MVVGDLHPVPMTHDALTFQQTNVGSWSDLQALFDKAIQLHGRVDHVFANAGISGPGTNYLDDFFDQETGALLEPTTITLDINLKAVINTAYLGMYHMRHPQSGPQGGSVVCTSSATCFQRFHYADYGTSKHGVLGFMRGVVPTIQRRGLPLRVNCIAPSWTSSGMVSEETFAAKGYADVLQPAEAAARSALLLMADESRQGQMIYSARSEFFEIEESRFLPLAADIVGSGPILNDVIVDLATKNAQGDAEQEQAKIEAEVGNVVAEGVKEGGQSLDEHGGQIIGGQVV